MLMEGAAPIRVDTLEYFGSLGSLSAILLLLPRGHNVPVSS